MSGCSCELRKLPGARLAKLRVRFHRAVKSRPLKAAVDKLLRTMASRTGASFGVRYADGSEWRTGAAAPDFSLIFRNPRAYRRVAMYGHVGLLEAQVLLHHVLL